MVEDCILADHVAIVTGSGRNIGREIAKEFAKAGARVVVVDIHRDRAQQVVDEIHDQGERAILSVTDVSDQQQVEEMISLTEKSFGTPEILINNAAATDRSEFFDLTVEEFDRIMAVNLRGMFLCTQKTASVMRAGGGGRIVNVASTSAHRGRAKAVAYGTAKSGVLNFTRSAAKALARFDIRVNTLTPTRTDAPTLTPDQATTTVPSDARRAVNPPDEFLVQRWGEPSDLAKAALFLVSPQNSFINGTELVVDGGVLT